MTDPHKKIAGIIENAPIISGGPQPEEDAPAATDPCDDLGPSDAETSGADPTIVAACAALDHSDTDNGDRLRRHFGRDLTVMAQGGVSGGDYLAWTGTHWELDGGLALATILAQRVGGRIALEAAHLSHTPEEEQAIKLARQFERGDDSEAAQQARNAAAAARKALKARRTARWRFAVTSKNKGRYSAMLDAAAPHLRRPPDSFNADPYKVVTKTHTLLFKVEADLECPDPDVVRKRAQLVTVASHEREDLITALIPVDYEKAAAAPKWRTFIERMLPQPGKRRTVQCYSGAGILGLPLQRIMFHYGAGANGKSVFLETLTRLLSESFAIGLPPESIVGGSERGSGSAAPDIARLFGKRMVRILELPEGKPLHEDLVKRLTGGEKFPVRTLFKGYFEFQNKAKPHMSGNGFPTIDGTDNGIWRRLLVVHWDQMIPEAERREFEDVVSDFLTEAAGILNWLIEGALDFLQNGLFVAPEVAEATQRYRDDMDPIGEFVADCVERCPPEEGKFVLARGMYDAYLAWSIANAKRPRTETKFGKEMAKRFERDDKRIRKYLNCQLHDVPSNGGGDPGPQPYED